MTTENSEKYVKALLTRAEKSLRSARILFKNEILEDAISRAYYAMYYATKAILFINGVNTKTHKGVISLFGENIIKKNILDKEFAIMLRKDFNLRQKSDYEIYAEFGKESVEEVINNKQC